MLYRVRVWKSLEVYRDERALLEIMVIDDGKRGLVDVDGDFHATDSSGTEWLILNGQFGMVQIAPTEH